jgi:hypothetical protein
MIGEHTAEKRRVERGEKGQKEQKAALSKRPIQ